MAKMATREAYGRTLVEIGSDPRVTVFDADLAGSTNTGRFKAVYPERHFDMGIAEANMVSAAAGMATCGKVCFVSSFAMFASERACEQIRNSVCYPNLNVKVCATHAGITVGEDGASHQCLEDLAIMRTLPNMTVLCPADAASARMAVRAAYENDGPFYVRLARLATDSVYGEFGEDVDFRLGKAHKIRDGHDVTIIACGYMVEQAVEAVSMLEAEGISARLLDMHTIKPIDVEAVVQASEETRCIVTCEEHSVIGGLGGAVAEVLAENAPCPMLRVGVEDRFGRSGTPAELMAAYHLTAFDIVEKCKKAIALKKYFVADLISRP